jgi:hypothetical protein
MEADVKFSDLLGKTLLDIQVDKNLNQILFYTKDEVYSLDHHQDCCETVYIESVVGDVNDLIGNPLLIAQEVSHISNDKEEEWTFYKLATIKGYVDIRWVGELNTYYSVKVDFCKI